MNEFRRKPATLRASDEMNSVQFGKFSTSMSLNEFSDAFALVSAMSHSASDVSETSAQPSLFRQERDGYFNSRAIGVSGQTRTRNAGLGDCGDGGESDENAEAGHVSGNSAGQVVGGPRARSHAANFNNPCKKSRCHVTEHHQPRSGHGAGQLNCFSSGGSNGGSNGGSIGGSIGGSNRGSNRGAQSGGTGSTINDRAAGGHGRAFIVDEASSSFEPCVLGATISQERRWLEKIRLLALDVDENTLLTNEETLNGYGNGGGGAGICDKQAMLARPDVAARKSGGPRLRPELNPLRAAEFAFLYVRGDRAKRQKNIQRSKQRARERLLNTSAAVQVEQCE